MMRAESMKKLAKTLGERAEMLHSRIGDDGEIRGRTGFALDIQWARDVLNDLEREFNGRTSHQVSEGHNGE